jgi:hypothetical protein
MSETTPATPTVTPSRLWKGMSRAQRMAAARAFWTDEQATDDQIQAAVIIAQQKKFRPKTVVHLDVDRKTHHLASLPSLPEQIAARLLVAHHLAHQRPMMGTFLDALGLAHDNGLIQEDEVKPDVTKMPAAVMQIAEQFPAEDVRLYLNTLLVQDPNTWGALRGLPQLEG